MTVARKAGVSPASVSRVLADDPTFQVTAETRTRILKTVREMGYVSDARARHLRRGASPILGILAPDLVGTYPTTLFQMLSSGLVEMDKEILFGLHLGRIETAQHHVDRFRSYRTFATLLVVKTGGPNRELIEMLRKGAGESGPHIVVGFSEVFPDVLSLGIDVAWVARTAIEQFRAAGCETVLFCSRPNPSTDFFARRFTETLNAMPGLAGGVIEAPNGPIQAFTAEAAQQVREHVRRGRVGVLMGVDTEAIYLSLALRRQGVAVPEEVALIGYGNFSFSDFATPSVSSFDVLGVIPAMADKTLALLKQVDAGEKIEPRQYLFQPALVARESFIPVS